MKKKHKKNYFTLLEIVVGMIVLTIMILTLTITFNAMHKATDISKSETELFQNASVALDVMTRDLQCIYYENGLIPFYHKGEGGDITEPYNNDLLCFISSTPLHPAEANTNVCEIKYQLYSTADLTEDTSGWLLRSATGDMLDPTTNNPKWNFWSNQIYYSRDGTVSAFTANDDSSEEYGPLIPYVTELNFNCFSRDDDIIYGDEEDSKTFPFSVEINLKVLDRNSWKRWIAIDDNHLDGESLDAIIYRRKNERTFTKTIQVGNRGQYQ